MGAAMFKLWRWRKCTADGLRMPAERVTRAGHLRVDSTLRSRKCDDAVLQYKLCTRAGFQVVLVENFKSSQLEL